MAVVKTAAVVISMDELKPAAAHHTGGITIPSEFQEHFLGFQLTQRKNSSRPGQPLPELF